MAIRRHDVDPFAPGVGEMTTRKPFSVPTNTPLDRPPADYCPSDSERWFDIPEGLDAGKTMFYFDHVVGNGDPEATVVFVHGNPECSYTYRFMRDALIDSGRPLRLIAMDHIGFGLSDQASFEMVDVHHSANLLQLVRHLDLKKVCLVVHDWGGPIGIGTFAQDPGRVRNLLVMNTTIFPMPADGLTYSNYPFSWLPWCRTPYLIPDQLWGGVAAFVVSHASPQNGVRFILSTGKYLALHATRSIPAGSPEYVWSETLRTKANAKSSKRNVRQTPYWGHGYSYADPTHGRQDNHAFYEHMQDTIPAAWGKDGRSIPACGFFGQWDACGKDSVIRQWQDALPQMKIHKFPELGHFIEEYKGAEMADSLLEMNGMKPGP